MIGQQRGDFFFFFKYFGGRRRLKFALINWAMRLLAPIQFEHDHSIFFFNNFYLHWN